MRRHIVGPFQRVGEERILLRHEPIEPGFQVEAGEEFQLDKVLALSDGSSLKVGTPELDGISLTAKVIEHFRGPKLVNYKKKRRKGYKRKVGHRQELTKIEILDLGFGRRP